MSFVIKYIYVLKLYIHMNIHVFLGEMVTKINHF